ncbi:MAG: thiol-disulfide isomerase, partial [Myxococcota bacterium]
GGARGDGRTLLFFLSPTCPVCASQLPTQRSVAPEEGELRLVLASDGEPAEHRAFRREKGLDDLPYVLSTELGIGFGVARLPTAVLIDAGGTVRARGLVNTREHLESLFTADELSVASIQDYLAREPGPDAARRAGSRS